LAEPTTAIARDTFNAERARLKANPAAVTAAGDKGRMLHITDPYNHTATWIVEVINADGAETWFVQRIDESGGDRWVIPPEVVASAYKQSAGITKRIRQRGARQAVETKRAKGIAVGNVAALEKARRAPRKAKRRG
jgi:hypothetical protein